MAWPLSGPRVRHSVAFTLHHRRGRRGGDFLDAVIGPRRGPRLDALDLIAGSAEERPVPSRWSSPTAGVRRCATSISPRRGRASRARWPLPSHLAASQVTCAATFGSLPIPELIALSRKITPEKLNVAVPAKSSRMPHQRIADRGRSGHLGTTGITSPPPLHRGVTPFRLECRVTNSKRSSGPSSSNRPVDPPRAKGA